MTNIYYYPEKSGLELVGEIQWTEVSWDFDLTVVWRSTSKAKSGYPKGTLLVASDSGCSCPSPFEDVELTDLEKVTFHQLGKMLNEEVENHWGVCEAAKADVVDLLARLSH